MEEIKRCEKCGQPLKKNGPFAHRKDEGEPSHKGPDAIYYHCKTEGCEMKDINITEYE